MLGSCKIVYQWYRYGMRMIDLGQFMESVQVYCSEKFVRLSVGFKILAFLCGAAFLLGNLSGFSVETQRLLLKSWALVLLSGSVIMWILPKTAWKPGSLAGQGVAEKTEPDLKTSLLLKDFPSSVSQFGSYSAYSCRQICVYLTTFGVVLFGLSLFTSFLIPDLNKGQIAITLLIVGFLLITFPLFGGLFMIFEVTFWIRRIRSCSLWYPVIRSLISMTLVAFLYFLLGYSTHRLVWHQLTSETNPMVLKAFIFGGELTLYVLAIGYIPCILAIRYLKRLETILRISNTQ